MLKPFKLPLRSVSTIKPRSWEYTSTVFSPATVMAVLNLRGK
jgi:hypothetical protein